MAKIIKNKASNPVKEQYSKQFVKVKKTEKNSSFFADMMKSRLTKQIIIISIIIAIIVFAFMNFSKITAFFGELIRILTPVIFGWALTFIMSPLYNMICDK